MMRALGLFSGIGGFELGLQCAGFETSLLCEIDPAARQVLARSFDNDCIKPDVCDLKSLPSVDVLTAGFPCQNLSLVGDKSGITGKQSGLINEVFRLVESKRHCPDWLVLENVPFMLWHKGGHAIRYVTQTLEKLGFMWAYRVVDTRCFGLPQRRRRVLIVASRKHDPRSVLFCDNYDFQEPEDDGEVPCGFSWTEGKAGLGWAINCVPTLKAGSGVGIPSPPAIWDRLNQEIVTPDICDAERMQGFEAGTTDVEVDGKPVRLGARWRMVGNAVSVPVASWLGSRLMNPQDVFRQIEFQHWEGGTWPNAAYGDGKQIFRVKVSEAPADRKLIGLDKFLEHAKKPLSARAATGFLKRAQAGKLRFAPGFLDAIAEHALKHERAA